VKRVCVVSAGAIGTFSTDALLGLTGVFAAGRGLY
jgi:hypothetical protein